jgi:hypothetical protein
MKKNGKICTKLKINKKVRKINTSKTEAYLINPQINKKT